MKKLQEWWDSKKTKHMLLAQVAILSVVLVCMWMSGGDIDKFVKLVGAVKEAIIGIAVVAGITVGAQGLADKGKEQAKIVARADALAKTEATVTSSRKANARKKKPKKKPDALEPVK